MAHCLSPLERCVANWKQMDSGALANIQGALLWMELGIHADRHARSIDVVKLDAPKELGKIG
jgi:hypothetical protein